MVATGTMLLSNVINHAAAAILMAPVAVALATGLAMSLRASTKPMRRE